MNTKTVRAIVFVFSAAVLFTISGSIVKGIPFAFALDSNPDDSSSSPPGGSPATSSTTQPGEPNSTSVNPPASKCDSSLENCSEGSTNSPAPSPSTCDPSNASCNPPSGGTTSSQTCDPSNASCNPPSGGESKLSGPIPGPGGGDTPGRYNNVGGANPSGNNTGVSGPGPGPGGGDNPLPPGIGTGGNPAQPVQEIPACDRQLILDCESERAYDQSTKPGLQPLPLDVWKTATGSIVEATPAAAGTLLAVVADALNTPSPGIVEPPPSINTADRAAEIYNKIVDAIKTTTAEAPTDQPALSQFGIQGNVAVGSVNIGGEEKVFVGIKVPSGSMRTVDPTGNAAEFFPPNDIGVWIKSILLPGEELAGVTATEAHAEEAVKASILQEAQKAGVDPSTIEGSIGAKSPVCNDCKNLFEGLPKVIPENPAP